MAFVTRHPDCIPRPLFPSAPLTSRHLPYYLPPILLRRCISTGEGRGRRREGRGRGMHTRRRRSRVIYDYAREHDKPRRGGQKVDTPGEGYASQRSVLVDRPPIYRRSRARRTGERRPKLADRVATSGELMGRPRSVVRERD